MLTPSLSAPPRVRAAWPAASGWRARARRWLGFPHLLRRLQYPAVCREALREGPAWVLDIGCAGGELAELLSRRASVIALDHVIAGELLEAKARAGARLRPLCADGLKLPLADGSVDAVVLSSTLQMVRDDSALLRECRRILRPQGRLVLTVPVQYRFLSRFYGSGFVLPRLRPLFRLPGTETEFLAELKQRFGAAGRLSYQEPELHELLRRHGFKEEVVEYCPRALGTLVYEASLLLRFRLGVRLSVSGFKNMVLYPLALADRILPGNSRGCELLVSARKE